MAGSSGNFCIERICDTKRNNDDAMHPYMATHSPHPLTGVTLLSKVMRSCSSVPFLVQAMILRSSEEMEVKGPTLPNSDWRSGVSRKLGI